MIHETTRKLCTTSFHLWVTDGCPLWQSPAAALVCSITPPILCYLFAISKEYFFFGPGDGLPRSARRLHVLDLRPSVCVSGGTNGGSFRTSFYYSGLYKDILTDVSADELRAHLLRLLLLIY